jgi:hypothetical protein
MVPHDGPDLVGEVLLVEIAGCGRQLGQAQWPLVPASDVI